MNDNTTTQFKAEGEPAFPVAENTENEDSAESSTGEKTTTDQTQSQEGDTNSGDKKKDDGGDAGFADHPRWKEREEDWNKRFNEQEKRHVDEIENLRKEVDEKIKPKASADGDSEIPSWFGGTEDQWRDYRKHEDARIKQAEDNAVKSITSKQTEEQKAIDDATKYFNDTVGEIEGDKTLNPKGEKVDRNKLLKFTLDNELVDSKGRWNYKAAFELMQSRATKGSSAEDKTDRKKIAGATTSENRAESTQSSVTTSEDFRKPGARPW